MMEWMLAWVLFAALVGALAGARGRGSLGWFVIALVISPLLAGLLVLLMPSRRADMDAPTPETHVRCPECRELVRRDARVCKHCGCKLIPQ